jgi:hypothetical protein
VLLRLCEFHSETPRQVFTTVGALSF